MLYHKPINRINGNLVNVQIAKQNKLNFQDTEKFPGEPNNNVHFVIQKVLYLFFIDSNASELYSID